MRRRGDIDAQGRLLSSVPFTPEWSGAIVSVHIHPAPQHVGLTYTARRALEAILVAWEGQSMQDV